ncbi:MAG: ATP-binding cassette domain-containing protein [Thermomicrobiales bacterium]|nr:ATP-binding cassette domain-containing protein [Thermomicrobiales bacterium]
MAPIISASHVSKKFKRAKKNPGFTGALKHLVKPVFTEFTAVDDVSFTIEPGESVAYVGPNGAGKSTTVKLLTGILVPSAGEVTVCDIHPFENRQENARNIGVVFGQRTQLWWDIPVVESLRMLGDIYDVPTDQFKATFAELTEVLDLGPLLNVPARQLSLGQRMRCDLAASLIHNPPILYLDEPTIGLDVSVKARFREFVKYMNAERGLTVMLTSHDIGDIQELCPRMIMIDKGKIIYDGAFAEVTRRFGWEQKVLVTLSGDEQLNVAHLASGLPDHASVTQPLPESVEVIFDSRLSTSGEIVRDLAMALPIADIRIEETSAESIIRNLYEGALSFEERIDG